MLEPVSDLMKNLPQKLGEGFSNIFSSGPGLQFKDFLASENGWIGYLGMGIALLILFKLMAGRR